MATILVDDDDERIREFIASILGDDGHRVLMASDGDEGVDTFSKDEPDLVTTDIVMPRKGGIETIIEIRRHRPQAKIIAISGGGGERSDVLRVARLVGACATIAKPCTAQDLLSLVHRCLENPLP